MIRLAILTVIAAALTALAWSAATAPAGTAPSSSTKSDTVNSAFYRDCSSSTGHGPSAATSTVYAQPAQVTCLRRAFLTGCKPAQLVAGVMGVDVSSSYRLRVQPATVSLGPCHGQVQLVRYFSPVKVKRDQTAHSCQGIKATKSGLLFKRCGAIGDIALLPAR